MLLLLDLTNTPLIEEETELKSLNNVSKASYLGNGRSEL